MIPNILHYVHLSEGGRPWQLHHYLSVKSAVERSGVENITVWMDEEPTGEWWNKTVPMVQLEFIEPPTEIYGKPITQLAHKSDVLRLQILIEHGGIYVDTDVIFLKPFTHLLDNEFILGQQGVDGNEGLCPAVILSEPDSTFAKLWLAGFRDSFLGGPPGSIGWSSHSVGYPHFLSKQYPEYLTIEDFDKFFWPLYHKEHLKALFEDLHEFPNALSIHLWETSSKHYLEGITEDNIKTVNTSFNLCVRDLLP